METADAGNVGDAVPWTWTAREIGRNWRGSASDKPRYHAFSSTAQLYLWPSGRRGRASSPTLAMKASSRSASA